MLLSRTARGRVPHVPLQSSTLLTCLGTHSGRWPECLGLLPSTWETWLEFLAPGLGLPLSLKPVGIWELNPAIESLGLCLSLSLVLKYVNTDLQEVKTKNTTYNVSAV